MKKICLTAVLVMLALAASRPPHGSAREHSPGRPNSGRTVIVDTDMGMDDARAILALIGSPGITLAAVITTEGSASAARAADNVIGLIESAGAGPLPVLRGISAGLREAPPWRQHAETLGGHPFPPPRHISQQPLTEAALRPDGIPAGIWLLLGPLSSLVALEDLVPGTLGGAEIWMPGAVAGETVKGWNLGSDPEAARKVLACVGRVYIVDTSYELDAAGILRDVEGDAPAAEWIRATMAGGPSAHAFLFDELAAAAIAAPEIFETSRERYEPAGVEGEVLSLERSAEGRISIVRLEDKAWLGPFLHGSWELRAEDRHGHAGHGNAENGGPGDGPTDPLRRMKEFHGHLGPYVVLGYRMGMIALETTGSAGHFEISAEVHSILRPPRSCLIDGVQLGSGCTLGKRNITVEATDGPPFAIFRTSGGMTVTIRLLQEIPVMIGESIDAAGVEAAGRKVWEMDAGSLFEITTGR